MAISQTLIDAVADYAWADIAKMAKKALLDLTISQSTSINGRVVQRADVASLTKLFEFAQSQANADANSETGGDIALVRFGERV